MAGTPSGSSGFNCGPGQPPCPPDEYCDVPGDMCDTTGTCMNRPTACDDDCPGVCGCDGMMYCNVCTAQQNGTDAGPCAVENIAFAAAAWPGGLDHIIIMRADLTDDTCIRVFVDAPVMGNIGVSAPSPWGVTNIQASDSSTDCLDWMSPMAGNQAQLTMASGQVLWMLPGGVMLYPCELDVSIDATFSGVSGGLMQNELISAGNVFVDGGCF